MNRSAPPEEEEEDEQAALKDLLPLARHFQAGDQVMALRLLRDPAVQATAAVAAAVGALREETREEMLKAYALATTGKELGALTVADKRDLLAKEGIELPPGLPSAEVASRFDAYLDAAAASVQPTREQKAGILQALGVKLGKKTVDEVYEETVNKARKQAEKEMTQGMALPLGRAQGFGELLVP